MNAQSWIEQQFWVRLYLIDRKAPMPIVQVVFLHYKSRR